MVKCCICYTADPDYFFPTFVSARQARLNASPQHADVIIFVIGGSGETQRTMARLCETEGIGFKAISPGHIEGSDAMMARLFLDRVVPAEYDQLLYLDGDTQITGSLDPLLTTNVLPGQFMAVRDPLAFSLRPEALPRDRQANYFQSAGLTASQGRGYFNSGVLRINRQGWDEIGQAAWRIFCLMRDRTKYPDQDALNLAGYEHCIPMSLCWNFPIFLKNAGLEARVAPRILHYMGRPKPWHGSFRPWGMDGYQPYLDAMTQYPELQSFIRQLPPRQALKYFGQQHYKSIVEHMTWRRGFRSQAMLAYESSFDLRERPLQTL